VNQGRSPLFFCFVPKSSVCEGLRAVNRTDASKMPIRAELVRENLADVGRSSKCHSLLVRESSLLIMIHISSSTSGIFLTSHLCRSDHRGGGYVPSAWQASRNSGLHARF
jgi:hypothetical protein